MRSFFLPRPAHLYRLAAAGAMLTCAAVVLNICPFGNSPKVERVRVGADDDVVVGRQRFTVFVVDPREQPRGGRFVGIPVRGMLDEPPPLVLGRFAGHDRTLPLVVARERRR